MANHTIYCRIPTPQEKKEIERQEQERKQKQNRAIKPTIGKKMVARSKPESKGKTYAEMTPAEQRKIDSILQRANQQQRQRYGFGAEYAGVEFR